jgi:hypothetical protein
MTDNFRSLAPIEIRSIAGTGDGYVPVSKVRFKCDFADANNTVSSIYDDKSSEHLRGTINDPNHVKYLPFYLHWYDSAAMQQGVR